MPSSRPMARARTRRLVWGVALLLGASGNLPLAGDDSPSSDGEAKVEVNGARSRPARIARAQTRKKPGRVEIDFGDSKDFNVEPRQVRGKTGRVEIDLGDNKHATVEIVRERKGAEVEINGYRVTIAPPGGPARYLFGQEQLEFEEPPLPPSQFNPDPGGGNLLVEPEPPPDLFPPILPQPAEYGDEPVPRSLRLAAPRRARVRARTASASIPRVSGFAKWDWRSARFGAGAESLVHRLRTLAALRRSHSRNALPARRVEILASLLAKHCSKATRRSSARTFS